MSVRRRVLVVSPTASLSNVVARSVRHTGHDVTVVSSFLAARAQLTNLPDLLITEIKLGEYNGLQLALRVAFGGVPTIVVAEKAYEEEIERMGMTWLSPESAVAGELPAAMMRLLQGAGSAHPVYPWYDADNSGAASTISPDAPSDQPLPDRFSN